MSWFNWGGVPEDKHRSSFEEKKRTVRGEVLRCMRDTDDDDFFLFVIGGQQRVVLVDINQINSADEQEEANTLAVLNLTRAGDLVELVWKQESEDDDEVLSFRNETLFPSSGGKEMFVSSIKVGG